MIEYLILILIIFFIFYSYYRNKHAVFFIVLANLIIFVIEMYYIYNNINIYEILGFSTNNILSIQLITGIFTHYDYIHILSNMVVLLFIGYPFEMKVGARKFIIIYLITGIIAEIIYALVHINEYYILLGASGSIFGIMGAYLKLYPEDEISMFLGFIFFPKIKVKFAVFFAALIELLAMVLSYEDNVAHLVHISAFIIGFFIAPIFMITRKKEFSIDDLKNLVKDEKSKEMLEKIEKEKIEIIRKILIEEYLKYVCEKFEKKGENIYCNGKKYKL
ncbi:MAG: rhomboid family intramembrane serine protease [Thermoplasmata archaeon]|nr:rhomboid family intramembrane serine protease [Thermoplasmata archaeon]